MGAMINSIVRADAAIRQRAADEGLLEQNMTVEQTAAYLDAQYAAMSARIQALEAEGEARMLGRPSVLTVDNVQATLENTSTYYIQVEGYQAVDLFKVEAGTVLRVTPHIIRDEYAKPPSKACGSVQDDQNDSNGYAGQAPTAFRPSSRRRSTRRPIVGAGQSLLIGGYYYEQKSTDASGIPILMHIPVLGNFSRRRAKGPNAWSA